MKNWKNIIKILKKSKKNIPREKVKEYFFVSPHSEVKGYITDIGLKFNSYSITKTRGWSDEKKNRQKDIYESAINENKKDIQKDTKEKIKKEVENLVTAKSNLINIIIMKVGEITQQVKKDGNTNSITTGKIVDLLNVIKLELNESTNISEIKETNIDPEKKKIISDLVKQRQKYLGELE